MYIHRSGPSQSVGWSFEHGLIRAYVAAFNRRFGYGLPKTPGSERDVEMSGMVRRELNEQRARSQLRGELVFRSVAGTPIDLQNFSCAMVPDSPQGPSTAAHSLSVSPQYV
jgi:hypothetical protein